MAADAARFFESAPRRIYDAGTSRAWVDKVLRVGHRVPAEEAFRDFAGHDPDATPLHHSY